jgi:hypothetical protein
MSWFPPLRSGTGQGVSPKTSDATRAVGPPGGDADAVARSVGASGPTIAVQSGVAMALRHMLAAGELGLPRPGAGRTAERWAALAAWGARDLSLARLAEGHVDAIAILTEAARAPVPDALYGVWASRSGGATVRVEPRGDGAVLQGAMRFCSVILSLSGRRAGVKTEAGLPARRRRVRGTRGRCSVWRRGPA